jgi:hypothetical protein
MLAKLENGTSKGGKWTVPLISTWEAGGVPESAFATSIETNAVRFKETVIAAPIKSLFPACLMPESIGTLPRPWSLQR